MRHQSIQLQSQPDDGMDARTLAEQKFGLGETDETSRTSDKSFVGSDHLERAHDKEEAPTVRNENSSKVQMTSPPGRRRDTNMPKSSWLNMRV